MSDPVTNAEVEDVLSSIRRLVSEDKRPMKQGGQSAPKDGKLVLTPSLRVSQDPPLTDAYAKDTAASDTLSTPSPSPTPLRTTRPSFVAKPDAETATDAVQLRTSFSAGGETSTGPADAETDHAFAADEATQPHDADALVHLDEEFLDDDLIFDDDPEDGSAKDHAVHMRAEDSAEEDDHRREITLGDNLSGDNLSGDDLSGDDLMGGGLLKDDQPREDPAQVDRDDQFDAAPAEETADLGGDHMDLTDDSDDDGDPTLVQAQAQEADTPPKTASFTSHRHDEHRNHDRRHTLTLGESELVNQPATKSDELSAKIAALETAISKIPEAWEPEASGDGDYSGSDAPGMDWEDDVELDATGNPLEFGEDYGTSTPETLQETPAQTERSRQADAPSSEVEQDEAGFSLSAEEYFDEEMLRDLVSEIVRSELQGALGERITRNVRKLVRREIHRALTAQELE